MVVKVIRCRVITKDMQYFKLGESEITFVLPDTKYVTNAVDFIADM